MDFIDRNTEYPRLLVISNNSFSETNNNGKTLASFFDKYPADNIAQLYFNSEIPGSKYYYNYFRITDSDVVKYILKKNNKCGSRIYQQNTSQNDVSLQKYTRFISKIKKYNFSRILREIIWKCAKWNSDLLNQWLDEFSPEIIFLCAGDSGFAYDITKYIENKYHTKLVVYITDDYILPRKTIDLFWWLRRNYVLNKMRDAVIRSDLFITISKPMKEKYNHLFGKDSVLAVNMTESMRNEFTHVQNENRLILVYAGGLHYRRFVTLNLLAQSLKKYNDNLENKQKAYLKIYSVEEPGKKILRYLNVEGTSEFCGKLNQGELKEVLNYCDIPVHVESFERKSIESTRLSISTKIPEYLSLGKPILAIGPHQVASMEYLKDCAFCITNENNIYFDLQKLFSNKQLREKLSLLALVKYEKNHKKEEVSQKFISSILKSVREK